MAVIYGCAQNILTLGKSFFLTHARAVRANQNNEISAAELLTS